MIWIKNLSKNITSNKASHVVITNELNKISKKVEAISTKNQQKN